MGGLDLVHVPTLCVGDIDANATAFKVVEIPHPGGIVEECVSKACMGGCLLDYILTSR